MANEQTDFAPSMFFSAVQTPTAEHCFLFQLFLVTLVLRGKAGLSPWHGVSRYLLCSTCCQVGSRGHTFHFGLGTEAAKQLCDTGFDSLLPCSAWSRVKFTYLELGAASLLCWCHWEPTPHTTYYKFRLNLLLLGDFKKGRRQRPDILLLRGAAKLCIIHICKVIKT